VNYYVIYVHFNEGKSYCIFHELPEKYDARSNVFWQVFWFVVFSVFHSVFHSYDVMWISATRIPILFNSKWFH
jgi:hypothetical protein